MRETLREYKYLMLQCTMRLVKEVLVFNKYLGREMKEYKLGFHSITNKTL